MLITESKPRRVFKDMLGRSNHYMVTILVGLHGIATDDVAAPDGLRAAWSPQSRLQSARRSKRFALSAALAWAVDAIDTYFSLALQKPSIITNDEHRKKLHGAGQSVAKKVGAVRDAYPGLAPSAGALVALAVIWRNRLVHSLADNEIPEELSSTLGGAADDIRRDYRGLDINRAIRSARSADSPTLKETASFNAACHAWVAAIDREWLARLSFEPYATDVVADHLRRLSRRSAREQLAILWGKEPDRRKRSIAQILQNDGSVAIPNATVEQWIDRLAHRSLSDAVALLLPDAA